MQTFAVKMAQRQEDFFSGEDLEAIFAVIDNDILEGQQKFDSRDTLEKSHASFVDSVAIFTCEICQKVCLSKRGLTRHNNTKHAEPKDAAGDVNMRSKVGKVAEEILHPLYFKQMIEKSVNKLLEDKCYPEEVIKDLQNYEIGNLDKVHHTYSFIKGPIVSYNGDAEKFYPSFYKCVIDADNFFQGLSKNSCQLVGFETANHVLAHLNGSTFGRHSTILFYTQYIYRERKSNHLLFEWLCIWNNVSTCKVCN